MKILDPPERRPLSSLRSHPEQAQVFGLPEEDPAFQDMVSSLRKLGQIEPILIKADGTILAGHMRVAALAELKKPDVLCRVAQPESYREEVELLVRSNTDRRQLTDRQKAHAFNRLRTLSKEEGGTAGKAGRPKKGEEKNASQSRGISRDPGAEAAAQTLGMSKNEGRRLEAVFLPADVPEPVKVAVDAGQIAPSTAAEIIKTERKRQGGEIKDAAPLTAWAETRVAKKTAPPIPASTETDHERHVREQVEAMKADQAELLDIYNRVSRLFGRRPLKSVTSPEAHHEYSGLIRDLARISFNELESVQAPEQGAKQLRLSVLSGGKP